jgi:hypothetical protein
MNGGVAYRRGYGGGGHAVPLRQVACRVAGLPPGEVNCGGIGLTGVDGAVAWVIELTLPMSAPTAPPVSDIVAKALPGTSVKSPSAASTNAAWNSSTVGK